MILNDEYITAVSMACLELLREGETIKLSNLSKKSGISLASLKSDFETVGNIVVAIENYYNYVLL